MFEQNENVIDQNDPCFVRDNYRFLVERERLTAYIAAVLHSGPTDRADSVVSGGKSGGKLGTRGCNAEHASSRGLDVTVVAGGARVKDLDIRQGLCVV